MTNVSLRGESIQLNKNISYLVIDTLYVDDVKGKADMLDIDNLLDSIKKDVFPYTTIPFAIYTPAEDVFTVDRIKRGNKTDCPDNSLHFCTDSGLIMFIREDLLLDFVKKDYTYGDLVESAADINFEYWGKLTAGYGVKDIALILAPGINSGFEFEGSGGYMIR
jgi:hypothetical protein